ncbi:formin-like protein 3 [Hyaena hyaena]|uniref:formin-like protein 3 n=1 Tax=Hyaena hyaena TaxID=95912 RepID=UPI0019241AC4|nr:formin-like protein 3 [Hyaena hyaena]
MKAKPPDPLNSTHEKDQETRHPWNLNRSPGRRAGCSRKRADSCPRRRLLLLRRVGGESGWVPPRDGPRRAQGCSVSPPPPHPASRPRGRFLLSRCRPLSAQPPPPPPPVPPRPDSPPLAKPDRAEPAADTRNQPPRPRPRLALTGCPGQSTPTCLRLPPILGPELQTGALFGQWQQGAGSCVLIPPAKAGREGGIKEPITSRGPRAEQPILGLKMKWDGTGVR